MGRSGRPTEIDPSQTVPDKCRRQGTSGGNATLELCRCRRVSPEWFPQFWPAVPERLSVAVEWRRDARAAGRHVYRCTVTELGFGYDKSAGLDRANYSGHRRFLGNWP